MWTDNASTYFKNKIHLGEPWSAAWRRFEGDMLSEGLTVHECAGPHGWGGPAVTVPRGQLDAVRRATTVRLEHHAVEERVMVYPAEVLRQTLPRPLRVASNIAPTHPAVPTPPSEQLDSSL